MKRSRPKELQTGVANLGCKKELETGIAERSCQTHLQKDNEEARNDDEAEIQKITHFEAPLLDCFWPPCYGDLHFSLFLVETCFQVPYGAEVLQIPIKSSRLSFETWKS